MAPSRCGPLVSLRSRATSIDCRSFACRSSRDDQAIIGLLVTLHRSVRPRRLPRPWRDHSEVISRLASHRPAAWAAKVSPLSKSVAAKAVSIATPSKLSIPTQAASNVPRPSRIGPRVAAGARSKVPWGEAAQADAKVGALIAVGRFRRDRAAAGSLRPPCNVAIRGGGSGGVARACTHRLCQFRARAAKRFFRLLLKGLRPTVIVTDKLRSYGAAQCQILPEVGHRRSW